MATAVKEAPKQEEKTPQSIAQPAVPKPIELMKFELVDGQHAGFNKEGQQRLWNRGDIVECYHVEFYPQTHQELVDKAPERIKSIRPYDLARRFNQPEAIKFRRVSSDMPSSKGIKLDQGNPVMEDDAIQQYEDNLYNPKKKSKEIRTDGNDDIYDSMTIEELKQHAMDNEIDLGDATSRDALLHTIRQYENPNHILNR